MEVGDIIELTFNPFEKSITWKNLNVNTYINERMMKNIPL